MLTYHGAFLPHTHRHTHNIYIYIYIYYGSCSQFGAALNAVLHTGCII